MTRMKRRRNLDLKTEDHLHSKKREAETVNTLQSFGDAPKTEDFFFFKSEKP
jgi:hypothetical protein